MYSGVDAPMAKKTAASLHLLILTKISFQQLSAKYARVLIDIDPDELVLFQQTIDFMLIMKAFRDKGMGFFQLQKDWASN